MRVSGLWGLLNECMIRRAVAQRAKHEKIFLSYSPMKIAFLFNFPASELSDLKVTQPATPLYKSVLSCMDLDMRASERNKLYFTKKES